MEDWRTERDQALVLLEQRGAEPSLRGEAAGLLVHLATDHPDRWEELRFTIPQLLEDPQSDVRRAMVALAAVALPDEEVEAFLAARLADPSDEVRLEAAGQLADRGRPSVRPPLATALQDRSPLVRFEAARGMAALKHSAGRDVLCAALEDDQLRFRALGALAELADREAAPAIKRVFKRWFLPGFDRTQAAG